MGFDYFYRKYGIAVAVKIFYGQLSEDFFNQLTFDQLWEIADKFERKAALKRKAVQRMDILAETEEQKQVVRRHQDYLNPINFAYGMQHAIC